MYYGVNLNIRIFDKMLAKFHIFFCNLKEKPIIFTNIEALI